MRAFVFLKMDVSLVQSPVMRKLIDMRWDKNVLQLLQILLVPIVRQLLMILLLIFWITLKKIVVSCPVMFLQFCGYFKPKA